MRLQITLGDGFPAFTYAQMSRARNMVITPLKAGHGVTSRSGQTAMLAIEWCEEQKKPYKLTARPDEGYFVELEQLG